MAIFGTRTAGVLAIAGALWLGGIAWAVPAAATPPEAPLASVEGPETWGGVSNVTALGRLRMSGQPDPAGIAAAAEAGVGLVVNLRTEREMSALGFDERVAVEAAGMRYEHVPVSGAGLDAATLARVDALVADAPEGPVWVHCASSNRVGAWLAWHLVREHGLGQDVAIGLGREAGLRSAGLERQVRNLVGPPADESVPEE